MQEFLKKRGLLSNAPLKTELLSGLTVALALVPEPVAFSLIAGLSPLTGLYAAFVVCLVTSLLGGRPGMISGATGAVAVVLISLVRDYGVEYVFATVVLAGVLQLAAGLLKLGKFIRLVPQSVMYGFVNGLALIIFIAQFDQFKVSSPDGSLNWLSGTPLLLMLALTGLSIAIIVAFPRLTRKVPAALVAILTVFALTSALDIDTRTVGDVASIAGGFPPFHLPQVPISLETLGIILPYAGIVAGVGLIESLLTLNLIDEITESKGISNRECLAQGAANIASGFFSGMGGCAMIGQSLINIYAGARARLSGITAALLLLAFIMFGASVVEAIPMAALTGVMIMVSVGTFEWASLRTFGRMPLPDVLVIVVVAAVTVLLHNLALAVLVGVVIASLVFAWENAVRIRARKLIDANGVKHYEIYGPLFFGSVYNFNEKFDVLNDPDHIVIDFRESRVADMSGIEALNRLTERYQKAGKTVRLAHLSPDCRRLLKNAEKVIEVNIMEDPTYRVMP